MSIEKIKQLEELVASALRHLNNLHSEKYRLEQRVRELEKEKEEEKPTRENLRIKKDKEQIQNKKDLCNAIGFNDGSELFKECILTLLQLDRDHQK